MVSSGDAPSGPPVDDAALVKQRLKVCFRADASLSIGAGHLSRCLTLAESLKRRGADVTFVCAAGSCAFVPRVSEIADAVIELPHSAAEVDGSTNDSWLTVSPATDAEMTITALAGMAVDWLVVDHYGIDATWESLLRPLVGKVMVIDDLADRKHDCDVLLDQNLYRDMGCRYINLVPSNCELYLGPRYAILRDEFTKRHSSVRVRQAPVKRLLLSFGGVDSANATGLALSSLTALDAPEISVDVIIGGQHPLRNTIVKTCSDHGYRLHVQTEEMARLIDSADLALGAGGSSTWERAIRGLPTLTIVTAPNQLAAALYLDEIGVSPLLGTTRELSQTTLREKLSGFLRDKAAVRRISQRAIDTMDQHLDPSSIIRGRT